MEQGRKRRRITVGVFTSALVSPFYKGLALGIDDAARENDVNVICYAGGVINPPNTGRTRNRAFDLINGNYIDGLIIPASPLSRYLKPEELKEFLSRFSGIPMINVGSQIKGIPSVVPDFRSGMEQMAEHLIRDHGYRRIALIRGLPGHLASEVRFQVYLELLKKYGIPYRPELVASVDLVSNGGKMGVAQLKAQAGLDYDVIMVVGDQMLVRVVKALQEEGIKVPADMKVVGLQAVADSDFFDPPLTVVNELIYDQARTGFDYLLRLIAGEPVPEVIPQPTELVVRMSCGCIGHPSYQWMNLPVSDTAEETLPGNRSDLIRMMGRVAADASINQRYRVEEEVLDRTLSALTRDLSGVTQNSFYSVVEEVLRRSTGYKLLPWICVLLFLYQLPENGYAVKYNERWREIWLPVLVLMNKVQEQTNRVKEIDSSHLTDVFRRVGVALFTKYRPAMFKEVMADAAGIMDCYMVLCHNTHQGWGRLNLGYTDKLTLPLPEEGELFFIDQLLPPGVLPDFKRYSFIVEPLYEFEVYYGYIVMSMDIREGSFYASIQTQLSGALNNEFQLQELRAAEQRFSDIAYSSSDWLWETDGEGRFTYCSEGVYGVLGYAAEDVIGRTLFDFLAPTEIDYRAHVQDLIQNKEPLRNLENWNLHLDEHLVGLLISGTPIVREDGSLTGYRGVFKDITEQKRVEEEIRRIAYYDRLTGLPNRTLLTDRMEVALSRAKRDAEQLAILFIDLDRFKNVNDNLGHSVGDQLLRLVAERLKKSIRECDTLARLGGDEFIILLNDIDNSDQIIHICKRIFTNLESYFDLNGYHFFISCSIGIALFPHDGESVQTLMKNADTAMYRAKENGRNRFIFYDQEMETSSIAQMKLENNLHQAVLQNEFFMVYQPQVETMTGKVTGLEALIRWNSPDLGLISPLDFIPIAEETGLIIPIGEWVLDTVIRQCLEWRALNLPPLRLSINVSARQFQNSELVAVFGEKIKASGLDPRLFELEITESAFIENDFPAHERLEQLKAIGFTIALDDFGTGYSSLSYLKRLPIDVVKIDKSFIRDITTDPDSVGIINAIVVMAKCLKLEVVAEGVETLEQLSLLQSLGCGGVQGYLFSRPLTAEAITELLREHPCLKPEINAVL